jgi:drug/metabolite transporter (DMT)-like permease
MFNATVFLQVLLFVLCLAVAYAGCFTVVRHRVWWVQVIGAIFGVLGIAAAAGVLCA